MSLLLFRLTTQHLYNQRDVCSRNGDLPNSYYALHAAEKTVAQLVEDSSKSQKVIAVFH